jgi:aminotransferase
MLEILKRHRFGFHVPYGAYYVMADISGFGFSSDVEFATFLIREIGVAVVPGSSFFRDPRHGRRYVRFAYSKKDETLLEADRRLAKLAKVVAR